ncbi:MAG TPA: hypothetical protein VF230_10650 [Acidimicrobiales bacterium]
MSDLSNLLGDLYSGASNPDGPSVRHEPAASDRRHEDDDLAAALSAALSDTPAPASGGAAMRDVLADMPAAPEARGAWTSAPAPVAEPVHTSAVSGAPAHSGPRLWARGDDDIFPIPGAAKKRR